MALNGERYYSTCQTISTTGGPANAVSARTEKITGGRKLRVTKLTGSVSGIYSATYIPAIKIYIPHIDPANLVGGEFDGRIYESPYLDLVMSQGDQVVFQWINLDSGVTCTGSVYGYWLE